MIPGFYIEVLRHSCWNMECWFKVYVKYVVCPVVCTIGDLIKCVACPVFILLMLTSKHFKTWSWKALDWMCCVEMSHEPLWLIFMVKLNFYSLQEATQECTEHESCLNSHVMSLALNLFMVAFSEQRNDKRLTMWLCNFAAEPRPGTRHERNASLETRIHGPKYRGVNTRRWHRKRPPWHKTKLR